MAEKQPEKPEIGIVDIDELDIARSCFNCGRTAPDPTRHVMYCVRRNGRIPGMMSSWKCRAHKFPRELSARERAKMRALEVDNVARDERSCPHYDKPTCQRTGQACDPACYRPARELIYLDELCQICGFFADDVPGTDGYGCLHPGNSEESKCLGRACPVASNADLADLRELDPDLAQQYASDSQAEDSQWMAIPRVVRKFLKHNRVDEVQHLQEG